MGVYGPFNASLNTVVMVSGIDVNADRVFIDNQSKYTLAIGFTPTQPAAVATLYGHPWYGEVPPGGKTIPIPRSAYNEQFPGYFWVLALDPLSPTRAYSGTVSGNTVFFVQALVPGEASPPDYAIPQAVDSASQLRVIALPVSPASVLEVQSALTAGGILTVTNVSFPNLVAGTGQIVWRIYDVDLWHNGLGFGGTAAMYADYIFQLQPANGGGNVGPALVMRKWALQGTTDRLAKNYFNPITVPISNTGSYATATTCALQLKMNAAVSLPAGTQTLFNISFNADFSGAPLIPGEGTGGPPVGIQVSSVW